MCLSVYMSVCIQSREYIKIYTYLYVHNEPGRNIHNLRYADDTTLMTGSDEELKSLFSEEESEKVG